DDPYAPVVVAEPGGGHSWRRPSDFWLSHAVTEARTAAGFGASITFHSLRHTTLTLMALLELNPYLLCDLAGHEMKAHRRYVHARTEVVVSEGRRALEQALAFFCPGVEEGRVKAEIGAAYDEAGHGFSGPRVYH